MSMFSSIVNRYFDLLFPKMTDALDTFLANLTNPSSGNNTGTPGDTETSPGFHTPAGTIILETQPSKPTAPADPIQNPSEPPKQILMSNLAHNVITFIPISSSKDRRSTRLNSSH